MIEYMMYDTGKHLWYPGKKKKAKKSDMDNPFLKKSN